MRRNLIDERLLRLASALLPAKTKRWLARSRFLRLAATASPTLRERLGVSGISASQRRQLAQRSVELRRERDWAGMQQLVESILTDRHSGLQPAYAHDFAAGIRAVAEDATRHGKITSDLVTATKRLDPPEAGPDLCLCLSQLAICQGLFEVSGAARALAVESAMARGHSDSADTRDALMALQAALDSYDLEGARALRERLRATTRRQPERDFTAIDGYLGLLCGDREAVAMNQQSTASPQLWEELVSGRTVALVGPAPSGKHPGDEIDNHQAVVRMNFRGAHKLPPARESGQRTDISYYNGQDCRQIRTGDDRSFFAELRMAVFKGSSDADLARNAPARVARRLDPVPLTGGPLMGPIAVFDLLCDGAATVKLYNQNFFVSRRPYFTEYRNESLDAQGQRSERDHFGSTGALLDRCLSFAIHDLLSQLHFVQNLWRSGLVTADAACTEVLEMSDTDYLRALDDIYGREAR